jgi:Helix-turn-helix domain
MNLSFSSDDLRPLVQAVVAEVMAARGMIEGTLGNRLGFPEAEAAALIGVPRHVLRDCRLRGEISGRLVGKKIIYAREEVERFLRRTKT